MSPDLPFGHNGSTPIEDNAPYNRSRLVTDTSKNKIERMLWPANIPDLIPMKIVWVLLKERIRWRDPAPRTLDESEAATGEAWAAIFQKHIAETIRSMNRWCEAVVNAQRVSTES